MKTLLQIIQDDTGSIYIQSDVLPIPPSTLASAKEAPAPVADLHPELSQELWLWRRAKSKELNLSAFIILSNRVLYAIANLLPSTEEELLAISGIGPTTLERYGADILSLVRNYRLQNPPEPDFEPEPEAEDA